MNEQVHNQFEQSVMLARLSDMRDAIGRLGKAATDIEIKSAAIDRADEVMCARLDRMADEIEQLPRLIRESAAYMRRQAQIRVEADARVDALVRGEG